MPNDEPTSVRILIFQPLLLLLVNPFAPLLLFLRDDLVVAAALLLDLSPPE